MTMHCPVCGTPVPSIPVDALAEMKLNPHERAIVAELARVYPRHATAAHLVDHLYGDDPNGGPITARQSVSVYVCRLRRKLREAGWTVSMGNRGPGSVSTHRLEPLT